MIRFASFALSIALSVVTGTARAQVAQMPASPEPTPTIVIHTGGVFATPGDDTRAAMRDAERATDDARC